MEKTTYWLATVDGAQWPTYRVAHGGEPACEVGEGCRGAEWLTGVAGDVWLVLCDEHLPPATQITEAEYTALQRELGK